MKQQIFWVIFLIINAGALGQTNDFVINHGAYELMDRWDIKSKSGNFSILKPYSRKHIDRISDSEVINASARFQLDYLRIENGDTLLSESQKPIWKYFYQNKNDFYRYKEKDFELHINPIWQLNVGKQSDFDPTLFTNSRGVEVRGVIDRKIAFYSQITTNQIEYPAFIKEVADTAGVIPYEGFWKEYNETTTDFFRAIGYLDFGITQHISAQLGYGRHFVGSGMRSLVLSDFSNSYPYLRLEAEIWKFKYSVLYAELIGNVFTFPGGTLGASRYPKKHMVYHQLDFQPVKNFTLSVFESVIMGRPDSLGGSGIKLEYLNPVIFYRAVEQQDGSADNILLGATFQWDLWNKLRLYGQFTLDEMVISELLDNNGWWGNKYAYQLGLMYVDLMPNLDLKGEINVARPFTYAHDDFYTSYTHYLQPLAHPFGANFREAIGKISYRPFERITSEVNLLYAQIGNDPANGVSLGRNPNRSYNDRDREYGHDLIQGDREEILLINSLTSYQLKHNLFLDLSVTYRSDNTVVDDSSLIFVSGFRWNLPYRNYLF